MRFNLPQGTGLLLCRNANPPLRPLRETSSTSTLKLSVLPVNRRRLQYRVSPKINVDAVLGSVDISKPSLLPLGERIKVRGEILSSLPSTFACCRQGVLRRKLLLAAGCFIPLTLPSPDGRGRNTNQMSTEPSSTSTLKLSVLPVNRRRLQYRVSPKINVDAVLVPVGKVRPVMFKPRFQSFFRSRTENLSTSAGSIK